MKKVNEVKKTTQTKELHPSLIPNFAEGTSNDFCKASDLVTNSAAQDEEDTSAATASAASAFIKASELVQDNETLEEVETNATLKEEETNNTEHDGEKVRKERLVHDMSDMSDEDEYELDSSEGETAFEEILSQQGNDNDDDLPKEHDGNSTDNSDIKEGNGASPVSSHSISPSPSPSPSPDPDLSENSSSLIAKSPPSSDHSAIEATTSAICDNKHDQSIGEEEPTQEEDLGFKKPHVPKITYFFESTTVEETQSEETVVVPCTSRVTGIKSIVKDVNAERGTSKKPPVRFSDVPTIRYFADQSDSELSG